MSNSSKTVCRLVRLVRGSDKEKIVETEDPEMALRAFDFYREKCSGETFTLYTDQIIVKSVMWLHYSPPFQIGQQQNGVDKPKDVFTEFYRHVRFVDPTWGEIDNFSGITFWILIDHRSNEVNFSYALCNGDLFDRKIGREISKLRPTTESFEYDRNDSLKNQILTFIMNSTSGKAKMLRLFIERKLGEGWEIQ